MITAIVKLPDGRSKCVQLNKEIQVKDLTRLTVKVNVDLGKYEAAFIKSFIITH